MGNNVAHNKASQHRSLRSLDLVSLGRCWRRCTFVPELLKGFALWQLQERTL